MMTMVMALLLLAAPALAQDPPDRPRDGDNPRPPGAPRDGERPRPPGALPPGAVPPGALPPGAVPPGAPRDGDNPRPGGRPGERPPMPGEGTRRPPPPPFNPDDVREWLKANEPETGRRLAQAEQQGRADEARRILGEAAGRMHDAAELKQRDPGAFEKLQEMHRLEREGAALAEQARRAPAEEKETASKKLQENLARQFDLREEQRLREIAELKRRVESLEKAIGERRANKDRIVDKRRRELLGERVDEDW